MELRQYATNLLEATTLAGKLARPPAVLTDDAPGEPVRYAAPVRPPELPIAPARAVKVPRKAAMRQPEQRGRILHALANHELQAVELFAWAILAFPDAPAAFRRGLVGIIVDEQRHCELYLERAEAHGVKFGDHGVTGHFWRKIDAVKTPVDFVCVMALTFENANLDFAQEYADEARAGGDAATVEVLDIVHRDEIRHVKFGWTWLQKLAPDAESLWDLYVARVAPTLGPERARGKHFDRDARIAAGLAPDFIARLEATSPTGPGGGPR